MTPSAIIPPLLFALLSTLPSPSWPHTLTWKSTLGAQLLQLSHALKHHPQHAAYLSHQAASYFSGETKRLIQLISLSHLPQNTPLQASIPSHPPTHTPPSLLPTQWTIEQLTPNAHTWLTQAMSLPDAPQHMCPTLAKETSPHNTPKTWTTWKAKHPSKTSLHAHKLAMLHAWCPSHSPQKNSLAHTLGIPLSPKLRLQRAQRMLGKVRFRHTLHELSLIKTLPTQHTCQYLFTKARATYRIRKLRKNAPALYAKAIPACLSSQNKHLHRRSLYALGKYHFDRKRYDSALPLFLTLHSLYPNASHFDDAALYLARIHRAQARPKKASQITRDALSRMPQGDVVHEAVWEDLEHLVYAQQWQPFLTQLATYPLPEHDPTYFSQGRLLYFKAQAHKALQQPKLAQQALKTLWRRYPFSFYGHLAHKELPSLGSPGAKRPPKQWRPFNSPSWHTKPAALFAWAGYTRVAAELEHRSLASTPSPSDEDLWRLALLFHLDHQFHVSHNIPRRRIKPRPWSNEEEGQWAKWQIAWPDPFGHIIQDALAKEAPQHPNTSLSPALIRAIMREESSFIPEIESYAGALGLMQLMIRTAQDHDSDLEDPVTKDALKLPKINIRVAIDHLFLLSKRMEQSPTHIATSYNAGAGAVRRWKKAYPTTSLALWVESIPTYQARNYTKRVIGSMTAYQWLIPTPP